MFLDRQKIGQNLRRMELVRQSVPNRDARVFRQILHDLLPKAAIFNAVEHPAEDAGRVGDGFLLADLRAGGIEVDRVHPEVGSGHLKRAARPRGGFLKDQRDIFARAELVRRAGLFLGLQLRRQRKQVRNFCPA